MIPELITAPLTFSEVYDRVINDYGSVTQRTVLRILKDLAQRGAIRATTVYSGRTYAPAT